MNAFTILLATALGNFGILAQEFDIDKSINESFGRATGWFVQLIFYQIPFTDDIKVFWVLIPLVLGASWFTVYFGFPGIRLFAVAIKTVAGKYEAIESGGTDSDSAGGSFYNGAVLAGLGMMIGAAIWFLVGLAGGVIFFYPPVLFIFGLISFAKGCLGFEGNPGTKGTSATAETSEGEVTHFQALTAALSATVGLGNIAGVAVAISVGGAGATFWMIVCGLLGMASKFVECTLGVKFREVDEAGVVYGGPMYYLSKGLSAMGLGGFGKVLAVLFAVMCIGGSFGGGNMFQANQAFTMLQSVTGGDSSPVAGWGWLFGVFMAMLVGVVIIGGIKRIATVTEKIVPIMAGIYLVAALVVILFNVERLPAAIQEIFVSAFAPTAIAGGFIGVLLQGFKRAAFSNEAGIGSAAIAHSAVKTNQPASEGVVALLEPFIDTVVICTMTALVIVITGFHVGAGSDVNGVQLTSDAFASAIGWFPWVLTLAVFLFAFSTMISWSYYGLQAWTYLFGRSTGVTVTYKVMFCICVVIGAAANLSNVIDFSDAMIFAMMVPNMIGLLLLAPVVKEELAKYLKAIGEN